MGGARDKGGVRGRCASLCGKGVDLALARAWVGRRGWVSRWGAKSNQMQEQRFPDVLMYTVPE
eukprot:399746-Rhodomonas_salina.1